MEKNTRKITVGIFIFVFMLLLMVTLSVSAASPGADSRISNHRESTSEVEGSGEVDVDGNLKSAQNGAQQPSVSPSTKPSTNDVGNGLGDKVSANAKTGDVLGNKNVAMLAIAAGILLVIFGRRRERDAELEKFE